MSSQAPAHEAAGLLTPADVARFANVSKATVYRLVDRGELQAVHVGRQLREGTLSTARPLPRS